MGRFSLNKLTQKQLFVFCFPISNVDNFIVHFASTEIVNSLFSHVYDILMTILNKATFRF